MTDYARFAAISCTHCPHQSERALERLFEELKGRKLTHFIHLGDVIDANAASVHADDSDSCSLHDEFLIAADMLRRIRNHLPSDCKLVLLDGNHDDNVQRSDPRRTPKALRGLLDPRKMSGVAEEYNLWKHVPYRHGSRGCYQLGAIIFAHGFATGGNSDELESIQLANSCGGHAHRLIVRGHTHRPLPPTQCKRTARVRLPWHFANVGYMAFEKRQEYTNRFSIEQWGRAVLFGETKIGRSDRLGKDAWQASLISLD